MLTWVSLRQGALNELILGKSEIVEDFGWFTKKIWERISRREYIVRIYSFFFHFHAWKTHFQIPWFSQDFHGRRLVDFHSHKLGIREKQQNFILQKLKGSRDNPSIMCHQVAVSSTLAVSKARCHISQYQHKVSVCARKHTTHTRYQHKSPQEDSRMANRIFMLTVGHT